MNILSIIDSYPKVYALKFRYNNGKESEYFYFLNEKLAKEQMGRYVNAKCHIIFFGELGIFNDHLVPWSVK